WKYFQSYFPVKLVKTHDLSPKHNYIIVSHPHGVLSFGAFINFATEATGFSRIFPSITPFLATLEGIFWIPIVREYVMSMGICPVSELALKHKLTQKGSGNAVIVVVGGASEALLCRPGVSTLYLKNHKGFVKLALKTGAHLVPTFTFGETEVYDQVLFHEDSWMYKFQSFFRRIFGFYFCVFYGQGFNQGSLGLLPYHKPIVTVGECCSQPRGPSKPFLPST
ncbi:Diacylglycerol O-acyltransferase 2-like protein 6, partial [Lemmus lemmus]